MCCYILDTKMVADKFRVLSLEHVQIVLKAVCVFVNDKFKGD